jgi:hypothetical protein
LFGLSRRSRRTTHEPTIPCVWQFRLAFASASSSGIAQAKAAGVYKGRPASIDEARVRELKAQGMRPTDIAKTLGIGRTSVYRAL